MPTVSCPDCRPDDVKRSITLRGSSLDCDCSFHEMLSRRRDEAPSATFADLCPNLWDSCGGSKRAILPQSLAIEPHFARKGCRGSCEIVMFLTTEPHFVRKGCRGHFKSATLFQSLAIEPHFVRKGCRGSCEIEILPQFFSFWRLNFISCEKGLPRTFQKSNFISKFGDRTSFRAKGSPRKL